MSSPVFPTTNEWFRVWEWRQGHVRCRHGPSPICQPGLKGERAQGPTLLLLPHLLLTWSAPAHGCSAAAPVLRAPLLTQVTVPAGEEGWLVQQLSLRLVTQVLLLLPHPF